MAAIHLIERKDFVWRVPGTEDEWETGYWSVSAEHASALHGGSLFLHAKQADRSHFGGTILSHRVYEDPANPQWKGRIVFRFRYGREFKGVLAGKGGWSFEKKIDWGLAQ